MKTHQCGSPAISQAAGGRLLSRFFILLNFVLVATLLTGCASPFKSVDSQTYLAWLGVENGTKKTFKGTIRYGGKDFPVEIQQRLSRDIYGSLSLDASYYVAGRLGNTEQIPISAKTTRFNWKLFEMANLLPPVPKGSGRRTYRLSGDNSLTLDPVQKTFQINGKSVTADLYIYTIDGIMDEVFHVRAWFSPEIPGGWIALEGINKDNSGESVRSLVKKSDWGAKEMFSMGERYSLRLVSIEEP